jgi:hypothetical protein
MEAIAACNTCAETLLRTHVQAKDLPDAELEMMRVLFNKDMSLLHPAKAMLVVWWPCRFTLSSRRLPCTPEWWQNKPVTQVRMSCVSCAVVMGGGSAAATWHPAFQLPLRYCIEAGVDRHVQCPSSLTWRRLCHIAVGSLIMSHQMKGTVRVRRCGVAGQNSRLPTLVGYKIFRLLQPFQSLND